MSIDITPERDMSGDMRVDLHHLKDLDLDLDLEIFHFHHRKYG
jgi:hypothetical protein